MAWKLRALLLPKKLKNKPSADKIMLTLFWDIEGLTLVHFTPKGETVNRFQYVWPSERSSKKKMKKKKIFIL
jgi:hypothetical protein